MRATENWICACVCVCVCVSVCLGGRASHSQCASFTKETKFWQLTTCTPAAWKSSTCISASLWRMRYVHEAHAKHIFSVQLIACIASMNVRLVHLRGEFFLFPGESDHPASAGMPASAFSKLSLQRITANWPLETRQLLPLYVWVCSNDSVWHFLSADGGFVQCIDHFRQLTVFSQGCGQFLLICHSTGLIDVKCLEEVKVKAKVRNEDYFADLTHSDSHYM